MSKSSLKILFVSTFDDPKDGGGAERTINTLMQALIESGNDVAIASTSDVPGLHRHDRDGVRIWRSGLKNIYWPRREALKSPILRRLWHAIDFYNRPMRRQLKQVIAIERPDLISLHGLAGWSVSAVDAARDMGVPTIQVVHDNYYACVNSQMFRANKDCVTQCNQCRLLRAPHRKISNRVNAVAGVSKYILSRFLDMGYYGDVPLKQAIHNARSSRILSLNSGGSDHNATRRHNPGIIRFGFIGTLLPSKGIELLLRSFCELRSEGVELIIAGTGDAQYVANLKREFASPKIKFLGQVLPTEFYPAIDIAVVPSIWQEPLGMVVAESFAFGVPVVGSNRGGIPEMISNGRNGFLFEPSQPSSLVKILSHIAENKGIIEELSKNALPAAVPYFDTEAWSMKYVSIYNQILATSASRARMTH